MLFNYIKLLIFLYVIVLSKQEDSNIYLDHWCGGDLQYLDDALCVKKFPSNYDRDSTCNVEILDYNEVDNLLKQGYYSESLNGLKDIKVDTTTLSESLNSNVNLCIILTKRIYKTIEKTEINTFNKYLCNGEFSKNDVYETWSSSKIFAVANAAGHMRLNETSCENEIYGLPSFTTGNHGKTPFGDLISIITSYDHTAGYSSNALSSYFHDIGWRERIHALVNSEWINATSSGQTLGGNYGEETPSDLSFLISNDIDNNNKCNVDKDPWLEIYSNSLSSLTAAELTRRITLHNELPVSMRFPGVEYEDIKTELYGAETSLLFPNLKWGGMSTDTAIFLQSSLNISEVEDESDGKWRIFSKLGAGYSSIRNAGEIVTNSYACLPSKTKGKNYEFTLSARGSVVHDSTLLQVQKEVYNSIEKTIKMLQENLF